MNRFARFWLPRLTVCFLFTHAACALKGHVRDARTGAGIPDAVVTVGDHAVTTDSAGLFQIDGQGDTILARAPGYRASRSTASEMVRAGGTLQLTPFTPRALYLSVYGIGSKSLRSAALGLIRNGSLNAIVIDIKGDRGLIPYPSAIPLVRTDGARAITTIPDLAALVKSLHNDGIYAIARIVVFKDSPLAASRPDLGVKRANGQLYRDREGLAWTDPFQAEVRNYNIAIAVEAARAGFDEIQFDYVRFPDVSGQLRFAEQVTEATRIKAIEGFLAEARRQLLPYNVYLAVDVFGYISWNTNDTGIGQQLGSLIKVVDYISPMLYPSCFQYGIPGYRNSVAYPYEIVHNTLENAQRRLHVSPKRFRPWVQAFRDYAFDRRAFGPDQVQAQTRAATDFGSDGWMLWNPRNIYSGIGLEAPATPTKTTASHQ
jgi:hypothetical protein